MKCANWATGPKNRTHEKCSDFSITVPEQAISLRTLLDRHNNGGQVTQYKPVYLGDTQDIPDGFERMDMVEKAQMFKQLADFTASTRGQLLSRRDAAQKAAKEAQIIAAYEAKKAATKGEAASDA